MRDPRIPLRRLPLSSTPMSQAWNGSTTARKISKPRSRSWSDKWRTPKALLEVSAPQHWLDLACAVQAADWGHHATDRAKMIYATNSMYSEAPLRCVRSRSCMPEDHDLGRADILVSDLPRRDPGLRVHGLKAVQALVRGLRLCRNPLLESSPIPIESQLHSGTIESQYC